MRRAGFGTSKLRHPALARQHLLHALMHRRDECGLAGVALAVSEARGDEGGAALGFRALWAWRMFAWQQRR